MIKVVRGVPSANARTVTVTARMATNPALPAVFPAPLDGILASAARRRRLGAYYGYVVDHHIEDLPLARITSGIGKRWVWAATCAWWPSQETDLSYIHRRGWSHTRAHTIGITPDDTPADATIGRWKASRIPIVTAVTDTLTWQAVGDPDRIRELLVDVTHIGKHKGIGYGDVYDWYVFDDGPANVAAVTWGRDGRIVRPFPARTRKTLGVPDADTISHNAYRPPYWRATPSPEPDTIRAPVEVIAPWTRRP